MSYFSHAGARKIRFSDIAATRGFVLVLMMIEPQAFG
jgi:hypothetical protein